MMVFGMLYGIGLIFIGVLVLVIILMTSGVIKSRRGRVAAMGAPFGCALLPVLGLIVLTGLAPWFSKQDVDHYAEIFGPSPTAANDRLLTNELFSGDRHDVWLRAEMTDDGLRHMLKLPGLRPDADAAVLVRTSGATRGLSGWWMGDQYDLCENAKGYSARNTGQWEAVMLVVCPRPDDHIFGQLGPTDMVYVVASQRK